MNTGQTLITIGAIMLLSFVILRINNSFLSTNTVLQETKTGVFAVSLGTSTIEHASSLAFDENTDTTTLTNVNQLTLSSLLGPEPGESFSTFDDFDDYDNYIGIDTLPNGVYHIICNVDYVNITTPDLATNTRTWHKKLVVRVTSPSMIKDWETMKQDTITLSSIFSYWFFR